MAAMQTNLQVIEDQLRQTHHIPRASPRPSRASSRNENEEEEELEVRHQLRQSPHVKRQSAFLLILEK